MKTKKILIIIIYLTLIMGFTNTTLAAGDITNRNRH